MEEILNQILVELRSINSKLEAKTSDTLPDAISVEDIKAYLKIGTIKAYEVINLPEFTQMNLGRKKCISKSQFLNWLEKDQRRKALKIAK
jgi:hypothetical protein